MRRVFTGTLLILASLALGCTSWLHPNVKRNALEAARVEWLRRGTSTALCQPHLETLSSYAYEASCGSAVTYVRCGVSDSYMCCTTMRDRDSATAKIYVLSVQDPPASQVCN